jgi:hypothetical protein
MICGFRRIEILEKEFINQLSVEKFEIEKARCDDRVGALEQENSNLKEDIEKIKNFMEKLKMNE